MGLYKAVNHDKMRRIITDLKGATIVSITAETVQPLTGGKGNPLQGRVTKIAHVNGLINWLYEHSVNKQRVREGQPLTDEGAIEPFQAGPRPWGKRLRLPGRLLPFVHHIKGTKRDGESWQILTPEQLNSLPTEQLYLELKPQRSIEYQYCVDGDPVDAAEITPLLPDRSNEGWNQGTDKITRVRDYQLINIQELYLNGNVYTIDTAKR